MLQRDGAIEIIRIIACFIVVCLHTSSWYISGENVDKQCLLIKCFLQDAVPLFWFITGWFLFTNKKKFSQLFHKTLTRIAFPAFVVMIVSQILGPWLSGTSSLKDCLIHPYIDSINLFGNILQWRGDDTLRTFMVCVCLY